MIMATLMVMEMIIMMMVMYGCIHIYIYIPQR